MDVTYFKDSVRPLEQEEGGRDLAREEVDHFVGINQLHLKRSIVGEWYDVAGVQVVGIELSGEALPESKRPEGKIFDVPTKV